MSFCTVQAATGEMSTARDVFERATRKCKRVALLWMEFALFEARVGNLDRARELFSVCVHANKDEVRVPRLERSCSRIECFVNAY